MNELIHSLIHELIHSLMNQSKEEGSELRFVENVFFTAFDRVPMKTKQKIRPAAHFIS